MKNSSFFCATIGKKQVMAVAGLALCGFVFTHAAGNILLFVGPEAYNKYGHAIVSNPLLYLAEAGLLAFFLMHIVTGTAASIRNFKARKQGYAVAASGDKATSKTTKTMMVQGLVLFGFVVLHLITFKYGAHYETQVGGVVMRDLFKLVYEIFQSPIYVIGYCASLLVLCFHLSHGLYSAFQTLGLNHPKYMPKIKCASVLYGILVAAMFISQPLYMYFIYKG